METISQILLPGAELLHNYAKGLTDDIPEAVFASKPTNSKGEIVDMVHPAFAMGHLATYPKKILQLIEEDPETAATSSQFDELFVKGSVCDHDPESTKYPSKGDILNRYFKGTEIVLEKLPSIANEIYFKENPFETARSRFPTVGAFVSFLVSGHVGIHLGQISSWRRMMGMPGV